jgi:hypothetical protein
MVAQASRRERCARCGLVISRRRTPFVWHDHVVCEHCHGKLRAIEPAAALCPAAMPVLRFALGGQEHRSPRPRVSRWMASMRRRLTHLL